MRLGLSLHIGANRLSDDHYIGDLSPLDGPENDANEMDNIARDAGFKSEILTDSKAHVQEVIRLIKVAAHDLRNPGDIFLLTYSGHGGLIPDINDNEPSGRDQTWCLYDGMLVDDELRTLWRDFRPGVRVTIISDSCNSGTMHEMVRIKGTKAFDALPTYHRHQHLYDKVQHDNPPFDTDQLAAGVLLLAACEDGRVTKDGRPNSAFTTKLLRGWDQGRFNGTFINMHNWLTSKFIGVQKPQLRVIGDRSVCEGMLHSRPFTI